MYFIPGVFCRLCFFPRIDTRAFGSAFPASQARNELSFEDSLGCIGECDCPLCDGVLRGGLFRGAVSWVARLVTSPHPPLPPHPSPHQGRDFATRPREPSFRLKMHAGISARIIQKYTKIYNVRHSPGPAVPPQKKYIFILFARLFLPDGTLPDVARPPDDDAHRVFALATQRSPRAALSPCVDASFFPHGDDTSSCRPERALNRVQPHLEAYAGGLPPA